MENEISMKMAATNMTEPSPDDLSRADLTKLYLDTKHQAVYYLRELENCRKFANLWLAGYITPDNPADRKAFIENKILGKVNELTENLMKANEAKERVTQGLITANNLIRKTQKAISKHHSFMTETARFEGKVVPEETPLLKELTKYCSESQTW